MLFFILPRRRRVCPVFCFAEFCFALFLFWVILVFINNELKYYFILQLYNMKPTEIEKEKERQKVIEEAEALIRYKKYLELSKKMY